MYSTEHLFFGLVLLSFYFSRKRRFELEMEVRNLQDRIAAAHTKHLLQISFLRSQLHQSKTDCAYLQAKLQEQTELAHKTKNKRK